MRFERMLILPVAPRRCRRVRKAALLVVHKAWQMERANGDLDREAALARVSLLDANDVALLAAAMLAAAVPEAALMATADLLTAVAPAGVGAAAAGALLDALQATALETAAVAPLATAAAAVARAAWVALPAEAQTLQWRAWATVAVGTVAAHLTREDRPAMLALRRRERAALLDVLSATLARANQAGAAMGADEPLVKRLRSDAGRASSAPPAAEANPVALFWASQLQPLPGATVPEADPQAWAVLDVALQWTMRHDTDAVQGTTAAAVRTAVLYAVHDRLIAVLQKGLLPAGVWSPAWAALFQALRSCALAMCRQRVRAASGDGPVGRGDEATPTLQLIWLLCSVPLRAVAMLHDGRGGGTALHAEAIAFVKLTEEHAAWPVWRWRSEHLSRPFWEVAMQTLAVLPLAPHWRSATFRHVLRHAPATLGPHAVPAVETAIALAPVLAAVLRASGDGDAAAPLQMEVARAQRDFGERLSALPSALAPCMFAERLLVELPTDESSRGASRQNEEDATDDDEDELAATPPWLDGALTLRCAYCDGMAAGGPGPHAYRRTTDGEPDPWAPDAWAKVTAQLRTKTLVAPAAALARRLARHWVERARTAPPPAVVLAAAPCRLDNPVFRALLEVLIDASVGTIRERCRYVGRSAHSVFS